MTSKIFLVALLLVTLAGCGSSAGEAKSPDSSSPSASQNSVGAGDSSGAADSGDSDAKVDCAEMTAAVAAVYVPIQTIAQLSSPESIESLKSIQADNLDMDKVLDGFKVLHQLDGHNARPFGDPKDSIDYYEKAATAAKDLLAKDSVTQAETDAFMKNYVGNVSDFIAKQSPISAAISNAGC